MYFDISLNVLTVISIIPSGTRNLELMKFHDPGSNVFIYKNILYQTIDTRQNLLLLLFLFLLYYYHYFILPILLLLLLYYYYNCCSSGLSVVFLWNPHHQNFIFLILKPQNPQIESLSPLPQFCENSEAFHFSHLTDLKWHVCSHNTLSFSFHWHDASHTQRSFFKRKTLVEICFWIPHHFKTNSRETQQRGILLCHWKLEGLFPIISEIEGFFSYYLFQKKRDFFLLFQKRGICSYYFRNRGFFFLLFQK